MLLLLFLLKLLGRFLQKNKTTILPNPTLWEKDKTVCQWTSRGSISWSTWCHNNPKNSLKVPNWTRFFYFIIDDFSVFNHHRRKFNLHFLLATSKPRFWYLGIPIHDYPKTRLYSVTSDNSRQSKNDHIWPIAIYKYG